MVPTVCPAPERAIMPTNATKSLTSVDDLADHLLTPQEAAELLGVSLRMMRRLQYERRIAHVRVGRHIRFIAADLVAYMAANRIQAVR